MNKPNLFEWIDGQPFYRGLRVANETVEVGGHCFHVAKLEDAAALLDEPDFGKRFLEEDIAPYGMELWPSAIMLAEFILSGRAGESGHALELGCGLAFVSTVATKLGWQMTAADNDELALEFAKYNASLNDVDMHAWQQLNWHKPPHDQQFKRIFAADILYQLVDQVPILRCIDALLKPGGVAYIADPCRSVADRFESLAGDHGFVVNLYHTAAPGPAGRKIEGRIFELTRTIASCTIITC